MLSCEMVREKSHLDGVLESEEQLRWANTRIAVSAGDYPSTFEGHF